MSFNSVRQVLALFTSIFLISATSRASDCGTIYRNACAKHNGSGIKGSSNSISKEDGAKIFADAKAKLSSMVASLPLSKKDQQAFQAQIAAPALQMDESYCKSDADRELISQAYYNARTRVVTLCGKVIDKRVSQDAIFLVMAHEIAHSIDVCSLGFDHTKRSKNWLIGNAPSKLLSKPISENYDFAKVDQWYPVKNLLACLRSENSVRARPGFFYQEQLDASSEDEIVVTAKPKAKEPDSTYAQICNPDILGGMETKKDAIDESIADYFAAKALALKWKNSASKPASQSALETVSSYAGIFCSDNDASVKDDRFNRLGDPHPISSRRINKILLAEPGIRGVLQCQQSSEPTYCDGQSVGAYPNFHDDEWPKGHLHQELDLITKRELEFRQFKRNYERKERGESVQ